MVEEVGLPPGAVDGRGVARGVGAGGGAVTDPPQTATNGVSAGIPNGNSSSHHAFAASGAAGA